MKNKYLYLLALLAIVGAILYLGSKGFKFEVLPECSGFGTLSLSQILYNSNDPKFGGSWWTLTISQNCIGQYAQATSKLSDGSVQSTSTATIKTTMNSQTLNYAISKLYPDTYIYKVGYYECWSWNPFYDCQEECRSKTQQMGVGTNFKYVNVDVLGKSHGLCYWWQPLAIKGSIPNTPQINWNIKIDVSGDKGSDAVEVSNTKPDALSSSGKLYVYWQGNLVTGRSFPDTTNVMPVYYNQRWYLVPKEDTYTIFSDITTRCEDYYKNGNGDWQKCFDDYNLQMSNLLSQEVKLSVYGSTSEI
jgi:hypothetical protein